MFDPVVQIVVNDNPLATLMPDVLLENEKKNHEKV